MTSHVLRLLLFIIFIGLGGILLVTNAINLPSWVGFLAILMGFCALMPWCGICLTGIYLLRQKKGGLHPKMSLLAEFLPALRFYTHNTSPKNQEPVANKSNLSFITMNTYQPNKKIAPKLDFLLKQAPDIAALHEINNHWGNALKKLEEVYPHQQTQEVSNSNTKYQMVLLSKHPIKQIKTRAFGRINHYKISTPDQDIYVVHVHPAAPFTPQRLQKRNASLETLANINTPHPLVILGDFNTAPWQKPLRGLISQLDLKLSGLPEPTFPTMQKIGKNKHVTLTPFIPLDYILVPKKARVLHTQTHLVPHTDHLAVSAVVSF